MESIIAVFYERVHGHILFKKEYEAEELYLPRNGEFVILHYHNKDYRGKVFKIEHFLDKEEIYIHIEELVV